MIELMIALVVLAIGVLAVAQLFPAGSRGQLKDRMATTGSLYAQAKIESLSVLSWTDASLTDGRHPPGIATEDLGTSGKWHRYYNVTTLASPLDNCKRVTVTVNWTFMGTRQVQSTTYLRK
jgi:hypothetical protein